MNLTTEEKLKLKSNLVTFRHCALVNGDDEIKPPQFHYDWSDELLNGTGNVAVEGYRGSGKTQLVLRSYPLFCLAYPDPSRDYLVLIRNNATQASNKLKEIQREYESNPVLKHNMVEIVESTAQALSVNVKNEEGETVNVRIECYGKGSSIRGITHQNRRPRCIICDDLQDAEDVRSDVVQESDFSWFLSDLMFLGGKGTRIFIIGNNLGERCIIERLFANKESLGFKCQRVPVEVDGVPMWAEQNTIEQIQAERESFRKIGKLDIYLREKLCIAVSEENRIFHKEDFRYFDIRVKMKEIDRMNIYCLVDPAASEDSDSDYRACVIVGVDESDYWWIMDIEYGRWDTTVLTDKIFDLVRKWNLKSVAIEQGVLSKALEPWMLKEMPKRKTYFDLIPLKHGGRAKVERIRALSPRFKAHTVWFAQDEPWLVELESELMGMTLQGPRSLNDDLIDALAYGEQVCQAPYYRDMRHSSLPRQAVMN